LPKKYKLIYSPQKLRELNFFLLITQPIISILWHRYNSNTLLYHFSVGVITDVVTDISSEALRTQFANAHIVDAGNQVVMPGLVDNHVHINEPGNSTYLQNEKLKLCKCSSYESLLLF
jgi:hypothetical protein